MILDIKSFLFVPRQKSNILTLIYFADFIKKKDILWNLNLINLYIVLSLGKILFFNLFFNKIKFFNNFRRYYYNPGEPLSHQPLHGPASTNILQPSSSAIYL